MTITNNDPKLTAFVLGELNEDEAKEIQAALDSDAELQTEVEAIRQTVAQIETAMQNEPLPNGVKIAAAGKIDKPQKAAKRWYQLTALEIIVVVSVVGILAGLLLPPVASRREAARQEINAARALSDVKELAKEFAPTDEVVNEQYEQDDKSSAPELSELSAVPAAGQQTNDVAPRGYGGAEMMAGKRIKGLDAADTLKAYDKSSISESSPARGRTTLTVGIAPEISNERDSFARPGQIAQFSRPQISPTNEREEIDRFNSANDEAYKTFVENDFKPVKVGEFSTFSIDIDTASYTAMRRYINETGKRPPAESVRLEEYINYFKYDYAAPTDNKPFAAHVDVSQCPWEPKHLLARIGIKGKEYSVDERPPLNLVFLIDVSGSMSSSNRLPLVKRGLTELVELLQPKDRVAIVTYAGESRVALPSVSGQEKRAILDSINALDAGGSTAGAAGIKTAYETARKYYNKQSQNRVILCTDGDFNVGETNNKTLEEMIGDEAKSGVFLTILGFGMGNYKDERLKTLSMRGNGNYGYIDTIEEARRLLVEGLTGTLFAIAKDVKIQVDFNPAKVAGYRLLGYENRKLRDEDFHNDKIDAGEIGAGHTVTALYEIVPVGGKLPASVDSSRYADQDTDKDKTANAPTDVEKRKESNEAKPNEKPNEKSNELLFVKLRYKLPDADKSSLLEYPVDAASSPMSADSQFAAAVALYGMLLRKSPHSGDGTFESVLELATPNTKDDKYRKEFIELVKKMQELR